VVRNELTEHAVISIPTQPRVQLRADWTSQGRDGSRAAAAAPFVRTPGRLNLAVAAAAPPVPAEALPAADVPTEKVSPVKGEVTKQIPAAISGRGSQTSKYQRQRADGQNTGNFLYGNGRFFFCSLVKFALGSTMVLLLSSHGILCSLRSARPNGQCPTAYEPVVVSVRSDPISSA
jgi:hypothetical protein